MDFFYSLYLVLLTKPHLVNLVEMNEIKKTIEI